MSHTTKNAPVDMRRAFVMAEALRRWGWTVTAPAGGQTCTGSCRDAIPCQQLNPRVYPPASTAEESA